VCNSVVQLVEAMCTPLEYFCNSRSRDNMSQVLLEPPPHIAPLRPNVRTNVYVTDSTNTELLCWSCLFLGLASSPGGGGLIMKLLCGAAICRLRGSIPGRSPHKMSRSHAYFV